MSAAVPPEVFDPKRLLAVYATGLLDTAAEENFDRLAGLAAMLLHAPYAFVTVVDETRSFWKSCIGIESDDPADRQNRVEDSFCQYVIGTGEPLIIGDAAADPRTATNPSIKSMGVAAWAGYPLLGPKGDVLGTFCVVDTVVREWSEQDVHVLATLAAAASAEIALRDAASSATAATVAVQRSQQRLTLLADVGEILAGTPDAEVAVGLLAERIVTLLCDWCLITVTDEVTGKRRDPGHAHRDPARRDEVAHYAALHVVSDDAPSATVLRTGRPVVLDHLDPSTFESLIGPQAREAIAALDPASAAIFPLQGRGAPFGLITLLNGRDRGAPTRGELSIARELSRRAGLSLENARLLSHHRRIADVLQASMLTEPPAIDDLQITVRYLPASEDAQVGGDWYDAFQQPDGATMIVIGDVTGHDLHAISAMGQLRTMMRTISYDRGDSPAQVLGRVDQVMAGLGVDTLCTALIVRVEPSSPGRPGRRLTWSSAGHPAPLIVHGSGTVETLTDVSDVLLGVRPSDDRHDHVAELPDGSTLVLVTDGVFERRTMTYDEGVSALRDVLSSLPQLPLEQLCDEVLARLVPDRPEDDVAVIAVRAIS